MSGRDPWPYDGPIARVDGRRPFNRYLWPLDRDWFWANRALGHRVSARFQFHVVALADGRWSTDGHVHEIERDRNCYGQRCLFATRAAALRVAAARLIRLVRNARRWQGSPDHLCEDRAQAVIDWARDVVSRETGGTAPAAGLRPLPVPRAKTGLPLFDAEGAA